MFVLDTLIHRLRRGCETMAYPKGPAPALPDRHGGALRVENERCAEGCQACVEVCPTQAIAKPTARGIALDLGRCLFCSACVETCPQQAIRHTRDHRLAVRQRDDLVLGGPGREEVRLAQALDQKMKSMFGRSLKLRQVSAGGNGADEADLNVLGTIGWDLGRFGIQFVASPRHADGLVITGPISRNMERALLKTWAALPEPRLLIVVGTEAISGGPYAGNPETRGGIGGLLPVDLYIPGWPPHPLTILDGLLRLLGRVGPKDAAPP